MNNNHVTVLSMLPPWLSLAVGRIIDNASVSNIASVASIAYCIVGVYVMLKRGKA
jgi:hypothetical protein